MSQAMLPLMMMMMMMSSVSVGAFLLLGGEEDDSGGMDDYDQSEDDSEPEPTSTSSSTTPSSPTPPSSSPTPPSSSRTPPPQHCQGSWSTAACSATCGGGTKTKTWTTTRLPRYGGRACPSPKTRVLTCNSQPCSVAQAPPAATS